MDEGSAVVGWDIGGVHTKAALVVGDHVVRTVSRPYEVQRAPDALAAVLRETLASLTAPAGARHAVTMTAELSQFFRTKADGVAYVVAACEAALGASAASGESASASRGGAARDERDPTPLYYATDGRFHRAAAAIGDPLLVAAANWHASASIVARQYKDCLFIDTGSTTTDIIPIAAGQVRAEGRTDPDRLASGELVYTGVLRTPVDAIARLIPWKGGTASASAEGWAIAGDAYLWLGRLDEADYTWPTPDGRPATREFAGERLLRMVCADRTMGTDSDISAIADAVAAAQEAQVRHAIGAVRRRWPALKLAVVTGLGDWLAAAAAQRAGFSIAKLGDTFGDAARVAPAVAVALLLAEQPA